MEAEGPAGSFVKGHWYCSLLRAPATFSGESPLEKEACLCAAHHGASVYNHLCSMGSEMDMS